MKSIYYEHDALIRHNPDFSMMRETASNCVYDLRTRAGITQKDLAQTVGVTRQTIIAKERSHEERENAHRLQADHIAFLVGATVLTIGIIVENLHDNLDPWPAYGSGGHAAFKHAIFVLQHSTTYRLKGDRLGRRLKAL